jgi:UDP-glucuronate decarboxylase
VRRPDIKIAKTQLKWEPKIGLDEGLKNTLKYFRDNLT